MASGTTAPCLSRPPRPGWPGAPGEVADFHRALLRLGAHELRARADGAEARRSHPGEDLAWWDATVALDRLLRHSGRWYAAGVAAQLGLPGRAGLGRPARRRPRPRRRRSSPAASPSRNASGEGGPRLIGELLRAQLLDELLLTLSPVLAGRPSDEGSERRLALVEGAAFSPDALPRASLLSVRRDASHLFLRYRLG